MKSVVFSADAPDYSVAPLVGARIEIPFSGGGRRLGLSLPSWERGLKYVTPASVCQAERVAPLVGARIEITKAT